MKYISISWILVIFASTKGSDAFQSRNLASSCRVTPAFSKTADEESADSKKGNKKAMDFLRKIGKVGGNKDFTNAIGIDEGVSGKESTKGGKAFRKARDAYKSCVVSGVLDDLTEEFPITSSGTQWSGVTDRVMGGVSSGTLSREEFEGKTANVLRASVSSFSPGTRVKDRLTTEGENFVLVGFVQMATNLVLNPAVSSTADASEFDGIELEVYYNGEAEKENFNVHLKNENCLRQFHSYRATFELPKGEWTQVRIPWSEYKGHGLDATENAFDASTLLRLGVVAIGKQMDVTLALSSIGFFKT